MKNTNPMTTATSPQNPAVGLDAEEAHLVRSAFLVARRAAAPDRFFLTLAGVIVACTLLLGVSFGVRAAFRDSLPAFHPHASVPSPLYEAHWYEPPRTLEAIMASARASK